MALWNFHTRKGKLKGRDLITNNVGRGDKGSGIVGQLGRRGFTRVDWKGGGR